jgi:2-polyprenyl-6-methoxyphenol hydroxylase-like FAD-dependent oxidoreductase
VSDVLVLGAGLAGLAAARDLAAAGTDVTVLEARRRLFGELVAAVDPDDPWSHPDAARLDAISDRSVAALRRRPPCHAAAMH